MSGKLVGGILVILALLGGVYYWLKLDQQTAANQGVVEIVNVPERYCPRTAQVVVTSIADPVKPTFDQVVTVSDCRMIALKALVSPLAEGKKVFIKLPLALAEQIRVDALDGQYQLSPSLGDVNNDNSIDGADESLIQAALFSTASAGTDIDADQAVTVLDLSLVRINQRTGIKRPDGQDWRGDG